MFESVNLMTVLYSIHLIVLLCLIPFSCLFYFVVFDSVTLLTVLYWIKLIFEMRCIRFS